MRDIRFVVMLLLPLPVLTQEVKRPVLSSHDRVDGPFAFESHVEDLQIFADGKVVYVEEATKTLGAKAERSAFEATLGCDEMRSLVELLDSHETRSLPKKISSKTRPIDFFWEKSFEITRSDKTQKIQIENFYPFLNLHHSIYPKALIELECTLQDIKSEAAKRPRPRDEDDWCRAIRAKKGAVTRVQSLPPVTLHVPSRTDFPALRLSTFPVKLATSFMPHPFP